MCSPVNSTLLPLTSSSQRLLSLSLLVSFPPLLPIATSLPLSVIKCHYGNTDTLFGVKGDTVERTGRWDFCPDHFRSRHCSSGLHTRLDTYMISHSPAALPALI